MGTKRNPGAKPVASRVLDALPDTLDFRDAMYVPALISVPPASDIDDYRRRGIPVLDQGSEGACTGFALATVANFLLRVRGKIPDADEVSAWMLYAMARRYDEWPGEDYSGSSARGAMKGWYKHGLCALKFWRSAVPDASDEDKRAADAIERPLGAYFRVNHRDLVAMHAAINETGILFATSIVHTGWQDLAAGAEDIPFRADAIGGHAFAIVGYDRLGFWVQNSWGTDWGAGGLARVSYDDWLTNGSDVWVASLGVPVAIRSAHAGAMMRAGAPHRYESHVLADLKPHIVTSGNDGVLDEKGDFGLSPDALAELIDRTLPNRMADWKKKRVLLYAHGGLVGQDAAVQTVANSLGRLLDEEIYPLSFIWRSDAWSTLRNILQDAVRGRRNEGALDRAKDFMLDRIDDMIEMAVRPLGGKALWSEMKENAQRASSIRNGAAKLAVDALIKLHKAGGVDEIHLCGHSAGSIFHGPVTRRLVEADVPVASLTLWAPACTVKFFEDHYKPFIENGKIKRLALYTLDDATEQDDNCAGIYNKSLLYLISAALDERARIPLRQPVGTRILGLERDVTHAGLGAFLSARNRGWSLAPGGLSRALHHGDFDDDPTTRLSTLEFILDRKSKAAGTEGTAPSSRAARRFTRQRLQIALDR